jgi:puromycin-sensitive aminopeptidase
MLVSPDWERDVQDFFERNKIILGGKTLEQYLEQLRVAVRVPGARGRRPRRLPGPPAALRPAALRKV